MAPVEKIPFSIVIDKANGVITLSGDLEPTEEVRESCARVLQEADSIAEVKIDAGQIRLPRGGVEMWIGLSREYLQNCTLRYSPSQLATNLRYDDQYQHTNTSFVEYGDEVGEKNS